MSASIRVFLLFAPFVEAQFYVHRAVALTGQPNYRIAGVPVFSTLNIAMWRVIRIKFANFLNLVGLMLTCLIL